MSTTSSQEPVETKVVITWKIENIKSFFETGTQRVSPGFHEGQWRLSAKKTTGTTGVDYLGAYLHALYCRGDEELGTSELAWKRRGASTATFEVLDANGVVAVTQDLASTEFASGTGWGKQALIARDAALQSSDDSDILTLRVSISSKTTVQSEQTRRTAIPAYLLDDPESGNVVFEVRHSADREAGHIIAAKSILSRRSDYFKALLESGFSESSNRLNLDPASLNLKPGLSDEDDMTPFEPEDEQDQEDKSEILSAAEDPDSTVIETGKVDTPAVASSARRSASVVELHVKVQEVDKEDPSTKRRSLELTEDEEPVLEGKRAEQSFLIIEVHDTPFTAFRGVLGYLYTTRIPFLALASDWLVARQTALAAHGDTNAEFSFPDREDWLNDKFCRLSGQPDWEGIKPCSPHAIYRLADRYGLDKLCNLALNRIVRNLTTENVAYELFSPLSLTFDKVQRELVKFTLANWDEIKKTEAFKTVLARIFEGALPEGLPLLQEILAETTIVAKQA